MSNAKSFKEAVKEEHPLQVVGAINANHALLAKRAGYKAIYLSGGGVAAGGCFVVGPGATRIPGPRQLAVGRRSLVVSTPGGRASACACDGGLGCRQRDDAGCAQAAAMWAHSALYVVTSRSGACAVACFAVCGLCLRHFVTQPS